MRQLTLQGASATPAQLASLAAAMTLLWVSSLTVTTWLAKAGTAVVPGGPLLNEEQVQAG
ncbi:hypothetical protein ACH4F6_32535 [Streptomyces sp. NPDC017936]|uniref:hypothetical protein n=1 Tax=Streptomyces sp. NPDC017936 TaxID=3365016 RepID=UPI00379E6335